MLTGWVAAPLIHDIEHAMERAEMAHVHDEHDGDTLREGCESFPDLADECPISLTKVQAVDSVSTPSVSLHSSDAEWVVHSVEVDSRISHLRPVRGPPVQV